MPVLAPTAKKLRLTVFACFLATGCAAGAPDALEIPRDGAGNPVLSYEVTRDPLANFVDAAAPDGMVRVSPTAPPASYSQAEQNSYWIGMTAQGMRSCGFLDTGRALERRSGERSAFVKGQLKIAGRPLVSCQSARRFAEVILAAFEPR